MLVKSGVWTFLHEFAMQGDIAAIEKELNNNKENIFQIDTHSRTPLHVAAEYKQPKAISVLVKSGANIEEEMPGALTSLHISTLVNATQSVAMLLGLGAKIDKVDGHGYSSLHMAAESGRLDLVELLVNNNADASLLNQDNMTPLCVAVYHRQEKVASLLYDIDDNGASDTCLTRMPKDREGIDNILISLIGDNTTDSGYHYEIILQSF
jgi:ankyrin repeat protein